MARVHVRGTALISDVNLSPDGTRALVSGGERGLRIVDISNKSNPTVGPPDGGGYDTSGASYALANDGKIVLLATGASQHWLASCESCVGSPCAPNPTFTANSLRVVKRPVDRVLSWTGTGTGQYDVHVTIDKKKIPALYQDMAAVVIVTPPTPLTTTGNDSFAPPVGVAAHYQVYVRDCASQVSIP